MSTKRELGKLIRAYRQKGWHVEMTRSHHWKFYPPGVRDRCVVTSGTPGSVTAIYNIQADLRRCEREGKTSAR
jgi:hypothetical protein